jgi:hypothetical protein
MEQPWLETLLRWTRQERARAYGTEPTLAAMDEGGVAAVDITQPVAVVRELRRAVQELGFVAVGVVPWLWDLPPNDRRYYPSRIACNSPSSHGRRHTLPSVPAATVRRSPDRKTVRDRASVGSRSCLLW